MILQLVGGCRVSSGKRVVVDVGVQVAKMGLVALKKEEKIKINQLNVI